MKYSIISWNVNGIRAINKKGFNEWLLTENPDIFCAQETKAQQSQLSDEITKIGEYKSYFHSAEKKGYSGVATYTKPKPNSIEHGFGDSSFDNEGRTLVTTYDDFKLFNIYFPNGQRSDERLQYKLDFYKSFLNIIKKNPDNIIICGDVNTAHKEIDLARPKENSKISGFLEIEREWIDQLIDAGFVDSFRLFDLSPNNYTWWNMRSRARDRNVGWRIDYFFVSKNLVSNINDSDILSDVMGSDHCPVKLDLSF